MPLLAKQQQIYQTSYRRVHVTMERMATRDATTTPPVTTRRHDDLRSRRLVVTNMWGTLAACRTGVSTVFGPPPRHNTILNIRTGNGE